MNTKQILSAHRKVYKALRSEYRDVLIPKLNENKARKKHMREDIAFLGLMSKTNVNNMSTEDKARLEELAKHYGEEFNEGIPPKAQQQPQPSQPQPQPSQPMMVEDIADDEEGGEIDTEDFEPHDDEEK